MKVAITGSSGFVGRALVSYLESLSVDFVCIDRLGSYSSCSLGPRQFFLDYADHCSLVSALSGCSVVIHLAGRAHKIKSNSDYARAQFQEANVASLQHVVSASMQAGIRRIVFVSSIGVLGSTTNGAPFSDFSPPRPTSLYAQTKYAAEQLLVSSLKDLGDIDWVILRPPLIYGPSCPGNLARLTLLVKKLPLLPFASIRNRKSFISINNFVSILYLCSHHPRVSRRSFVVSDCDDISVSEIFACLLLGLCKQRVRLFRFPLFILSFLSRIFCVFALYKQVSSELLIDPFVFLSVTGWVPPVRCRDELVLTASSFR